MTEDELARLLAERAAATSAIVESDAAKRIVVSGPGTGKSFTFRKALAKALEDADEQIKYLCEGSPDQPTRQEAILAAQAWPLAFTEKGKRWAQENGNKETTVGGYVDWLSKNYPWPVKTDPIVGWRKRQGSLRAEKDRHTGLKKYADLMLQTEQFRSDMDEAEASLSRHIDQQIDEARERRAMGEGGSQP